MPAPWPPRTDPADPDAAAGRVLDYYLHTALAAGGHWDQSAALHQSALAAARQAGDRLGEAGALSLGISCYRATRG